VTKLAIGVEGGFQTDEKRFTFQEHNSVVVLPGWDNFPLPNPELPEIVSFVFSLMIKGLMEIYFEGFYLKMVVYVEH